MRVEVKEALWSMKVLQMLTQQTVPYLEKLTDADFEVELIRKPAPAVGILQKDKCFAGPGPRDFERLAAASVLLARYLGVSP